MNTVSAAGKKQAQAKDAAKANLLKQRGQPKRAADASKVLAFLVDTTGGEGLQNYLARAPELFSQKQCQELLDLLKALGMHVDLVRNVIEDPNTEVLHCVRCHQPYRECDNVGITCVIKHTPYDDFEVLPMFDTVETTCTSCHISDYDDAIFPEVCVRESHTTNPRDAWYGTTIKSCEDMGCTAAKSSSGPSKPKREGAYFSTSPVRIAKLTIEAEEQD